MLTVALFFYNLLFPPVFALIFLPGMLWKLWKRGGWKETFRERFAIYGDREKELRDYRGAIWIHAVSVGEAEAAVSFIRNYRKLVPDRKFIISTTTTTGQQTARKAALPRTTTIFCPVDFRPLIRRTLNLLQPAELVIFETELWPNMITMARSRGIPVFVVNARLSDHSARSYRRTRLLIFDGLLRKLNGVLAQSEQDKKRYLAVSPRANVSNIGNLKFDSEMPELPETGVLTPYFGTGNVTIIAAASTHDREETLITETFQQLQRRFTGLKLVLIPRHSERGRDVAEMLKKTSLSFCRRSTGEIPEKPVEVLLADTTGEMPALLQHADVVIMGKSLAGNDGGHNMIEPAQLHRAIVTGPAVSNFRDLLRVLQANDAVEVADDSHLEDTLAQLLDDSERRRIMGENAGRVVEENRGATERAVKVLEAALTEKGE